MAIAFVVAFIVTIVLAKRDEKKAVKQTSDKAAA
jgi:PTS system sucrose-specific IIC component